MPIYYGYPQTTTTVPSQPPTPYPQQQNTYPQILAFVHGLDGANQFQMGPNSKALLMDLDDDTFYIKTTDPMARSYPLEAFSFTKKEIPASGSVTRDEYNKLVQMLEEQKKMLDDLTK